MGGMGTGEGKDGEIVVEVLFALRRCGSVAMGRGLLL